MSFDARSAILHEIGAELQSGARAYVTGDRENLETEVSIEVLRRVPRHLEAIGEQDRLALALDELVVLVPSGLTARARSSLSAPTGSP
ncbi:MAG TPA: hypothetical protein VH538_09335 [Gaiellaceae bacterium]|jgi:hypothetical protein